MKTLIKNRRSTGGHVLMMVLVTTGVIGLLLASYLKLTQSQMLFTHRSQTWNNCIPIIEAGIEECLAQLNASANTNLAASDWTAISGGHFYKQRAMGDGYYRATVYCSNILMPVIVVTGYLPAPSTLASYNPSWMLAAYTPDPNIRYIARTVRVTAAKQPALLKGMVAKQDIDLGGNTCLVDSYNSSVAGYNAATAGDKGDVATNSDMVGAVGVGNAKIKGKLMTGPKATAKVGPNGIVGSVTWHLNNKGIQPGWWRKDMNIDIPDIQAPWSGGAVAPTSSGSYKYLLDGGNYELSSLNLSGSEKMHIKNPSILYVKGNITLSGEVKLNPNAKLTLYCGGTKIILSGTYDKGDIPADFMVFGLPSVKEVEVSGVALVLYAPSAKLTLNGNSHYYGASVSKSVTMNGTTGFHYDEALGTSGNFRQYVLTSWNEL